MACKTIAVALSMIVAASPVAASQPDPALEANTSEAGAPEAGAPQASAGARYCLRMEPITGSRLETIRCETRDEWVRLEVDLDHEWAREGVRVIDSTT